MTTPRIGLYSTGGLAATGWTMGGWFRFTSESINGTQRGLMSIWDASKVESDGRVCRLLKLNSGKIAFETWDGAASCSIFTPTAPDLGSCYHLVGRYDPTGEQSVWMNGVKTSTAAGVPATLNQPYWGHMPAIEIGRTDGAWYLDGDGSLMWACATALSDLLILDLFWQSRAMYNV